jgi:hypothetical protein
MTLRDAVKVSVVINTGCVVVILLVVRVLFFLNLCPNWIDTDAGFSAHSR